MKHCKVPSNRSEAESLERRSVRLRKLLSAWLTDRGRTLRGLAAELGYDHSKLSRFRSGEWRPKTSSPRSIQFLEALEHRLSTRDTVTVETASPPAYRGTGDPGYLWYRNNFKRLQQVHQKFDDASGFPLLDEFYIDALHGPSAYKSRMCSMTLFVYASLLVSLADRHLASTVSRTRLEDLLERVYNLDESGRSQLVRCTQPGPVGQRLVGYGGVSTVAATLLLHDQGRSHDVWGAPLESGLIRLFAAAQAPHDYREGHLDNFFHLLELTLERDVGAGQGWVKKAGELVRTQAGEVCLELALRRRPRVDAP